MSVRRVAVTGLGAITAIGNTAADTFANALASRSGIRRAPELAVGTVVPLVASAAFDAKGVVLPRRTAPMDRATAMAVAVARQAVADAGTCEVASERTAIYWGTGMGAAGTVEDAYYDIFSTDTWRIKPSMIVTVMNNAAAAQISLDFGITGPALTYSVACASSAIAVGEAMRAIRFGIIDRAIVGGSEASLTRGVLCAWAALRALATEDVIDPAGSCKPFAMDRSGFVLAEGAAALVLESADSANARGARIYAELAGYGSSGDATHMADPSSDGQVQAITAALRDAHVDPSNVGYINAHGTATITGDRTESESICRVFGAHAGRALVSSTKALHGHAMGATGAIELVITTLAVHSGSLPPAAHRDRADPELDLNFVCSRSPLNASSRIAISNSFAFGGTNVVLVVTAAGASRLKH